MIKSRLISPYNATGGSNLNFANKRAGVYLIYKSDVLRYVGYSGVNLYKTCTRHFQKWSKKYGATGITYYGQDMSKFKVRVILCTASRAEKLEKALIKKYKPKDNPDKLKQYELTRYDQKAYEDFEATPAVNWADLPATPF